MRTPWCHPPTGAFPRGNAPVLQPTGWGLLSRESARAVRVGPPFLRVFSTIARLCQGAGPAGEDRQARCLAPGALGSGATAPALGAVAGRRQRTGEPAG